jgi:hypothetical protein
MFRKRDALCFKVVDVLEAVGVATEGRLAAWATSGVCMELGAKGLGRALGS